MRKWVVYCVVMLVSLSALAGCGAKENAPAAEEQRLVASAGTNTAGEKGLYVNGVIPLQFEDPDGAFTEKSCFYDTYGSMLYMLWMYGGQGQELLSLYVFDGETKEMEQQPFAMRLPDGEKGYIQSMDVRDGGQISFRMRNSEGDFLVITDMEGNILTRQESFPDQEAYPWNADMLRRFENRIYDIGDGTAILSRCRDQDNVTELFLYDAETGEETSLAVFDGELVRSLCMNGEDTMYYTTLESINRWDKKSNTRTRLLELHGNGFNASTVSNNLLVNSQGELLICELDGDIPCVFVLSEEELQKEDELRIAYLTRLGSDALARPAKMFFQSNPELKLVQEQCEKEEDREAARDRVFMELAAGRGPELMWVREEDMYVLQEKGLLMDMSELVQDDIKEQIWPIVLQSGTVDGQLVGMKLYAQFDTIFVSDALWKGDSWTLEDVLGIIESREDWDTAFMHEWESIGPYELLSEVLLTDLDGSEFLDMEQGCCSFDSPEFIRLLEICKKYGQTEQERMTGEEQSGQLKEGNSVAWVGCMAGIPAFSSSMNMFGEGAHIVGFPTREGGKNYIMADNAYLVVNANAKHLEEIKGLLAYLLSYDKQFEESDESVRMDVVRDSVVYNEFEEKYVLKLSAKENVIMHIELKPDGTSWMEEYLAFVESCEPAPRWRYTPVGMILSEELQPYFAGDKSAQEVVNIIQSRVSLYLAETR